MKPHLAHLRFKEIGKSLYENAWKHGHLDFETRKRNIDTNLIFDENACKQSLQSFETYFTEKKVREDDKRPLVVGKVLDINSKATEYCSESDRTECKELNNEAVSLVLEYTCDRSIFRTRGEVII